MVNWKSEDAKAGLMFLAVGLFFGAITAWQLDIGTLDQVGSGFFPLALCILLVLLGAIVFFKALPAEEIQRAINWRAVAFIGSAPVAFGLTVRSLGLLPALLISVFLAVFASRTIGLLKGVLITAGVTVFCIAVFKFGVRVPYALINPSFIY